MSGVAVIIPCFNLGRTVEEAVESVRRQTHPAAELLVVDDGSDDAYTLQALARVAQDGVQVVRTENRGVAAARNLGVSLTSSPYIVLLDADDLLEPTYLQRLSGTLDAAPDLAFVTCGMQAFGEADYVWTPPECTWVEVLARGGPHISTMFRRSTWNDVGGFDPALEGYEDMDFWLSVVEGDHRGVVIPEPLLRYRVRTGSRYQQAIMGARYAATMDTIQRKHPPATREAGRSLLLEKEEFLAEQRAHRNHLAARRAELDQVVSALKHEVGQAKAQLVSAGKELIDWGDLRRVSPISPVWGLDRGKPLDREYIEGFLARNRTDIRGRVLEIKDAGYTRYFGGANVAQVEILDVDESNPVATIIADLSEPSSLPDSAFNCFIFTQTLHIIYDVPAVLRSIYRLLKPGGVLLCTVPCVSRVSYEDGGLDEGDFWRFTPSSLRALFAEVFPADAFEVTGYGNVMTCAAFLHGLSPHEVPREVMETPDPAFPLLCSIRAVKPLVAPLHPARPCLAPSQRGIAMPGLSSSITGSALVRPTRTGCASGWTSSAPRCGTFGTTAPRCHSTSLPQQSPVERRRLVPLRSRWMTAMSRISTWYRRSCSSSGFPRRSL